MHTILRMQNYIKPLKSMCKYWYNVWNFSVIGISLFLCCSIGLGYIGYKGSPDALKTVCKHVNVIVVNGQKNRAVSHAFGNSLR